MVNVFDQMGHYWAEIADKSQTQAQIQFLKNRLKPDRCVLDLACGTGRHLIPLSLQGWNIVGLDVSINLLKIAKQRERKIQVVRGDLRFLPFKSEAFSAVVSMDTSFGYLPSKKANQQSLAETRRIMGQGGILIIDVFNRISLKARNQPKASVHKWKEYPSFFLKQKRTLNSTGRQLRDLWTIRDKITGRLKRFRHSVQLFGRGEMQVFLEVASFEVEQVYGGYDCEFFSDSSSRLIFVALAK